MGSNIGAHPPPIALNQAVPPPSYQTSTVDNVDKTYLSNAHRLGLLAMDSILIEMGENGRQQKLHYSKVHLYVYNTAIPNFLLQSPNYTTDVQWLFEEVSMELGAAHVQAFLEKVLVS